VNYKDVYRVNIRIITPSWAWSFHSIHP